MGFYIKSFTFRCWQVNDINDIHHKKLGQYRRLGVGSACRSNALPVILVVSIPLQKIQVRGEW